MFVFKLIEGLVNFVFGIAEVFLTLRFVLKLFGANAAVDFVVWIYDTTSMLMAPFRNIFPTASIEGSYVLEFNTLFAMVIYSLLYLATVEVISYFARLSRSVEDK